MKWQFGKWLVLLVGGSVIAGCDSNTGTGALVGGAGGAAVGGLIGANSHQRAGEGALIGGIIGAGTGALIGHGMDQDDARHRREAEERSYGDRSYADSSSRDVNGGRITKEDVMSWSARGTRDDIIIDRINRSGTVFYLTAADETDLRDGGVSNDVIRAMKDTGRR